MISKLKLWAKTFFCLPIAILFVAVSAGWVGDSLRELIQLGTVWPSGYGWYDPHGWVSWLGSLLSSLSGSWSHKSHVLGANVLGGVCIFLLSICYVRKNRKNIFSSFARLSSEAVVKQKTVLIVGLSKFGASRKEVQISQGESKKSEDGAKEITFEDILRAADKLPVEVLAKEADAFKAEAKAFCTEEEIKTLEKFSWQQAVRLVWRHVAGTHQPQSLKAILVLPSYETDKYFIEFQKFLRGKLQDAKNRGLIAGEIPAIEKGISRPINYENLNDIVDALKASALTAKKVYRAKDNEICVDTTAGTKTFSVAAATITLNGGLIFSYINNSGKHIYYNAKIESGDFWEAN